MLLSGVEWIKDMKLEWCSVFIGVNVLTVLLLVVDVTSTKPT